jgi:hypothetical protein
MKGGPKKARSRYYGQSFKCLSQKTIDNRALLMMRAIEKEEKAKAKKKAEA